MIQFIKTSLATVIECTNSGVSFTPTRGEDGSSGYDLKACILERITIYPDEVVKIPTGIKIWVGSSHILRTHNDEHVLWAGLLMPRSSSKGLILNNTIGLIDNSYQGEIFCKYRNPTNTPIDIEIGESFIQLVIIPTWIGKITEVKEFASSTERGEGGFGSTNKEWRE